MIRIPTTVCFYWVDTILSSMSFRIPGSSTGHITVRLQANSTMVILQVHCLHTKIFILTFPQHRWADDAAYKAGLAYLKLGDESGFLQQMYDALSMPDGDMASTIREELLWFADGLPSDTIRQLFSSSPDPITKEFLNYALGKQLIIEKKYREAKDTFIPLCEHPITSSVAQNCTENIETLNFILDHESNTPENSFAIATFILDKVTFFEDELFYGYGRSVEDDWAKIQERNNLFQSTLFARMLVDGFPNSQLIPDAWCLIGDSFQELSYFGSPLPFEGQGTFDGYDVYTTVPYKQTHRFQYREDATYAYEQCISSSTDPDQIAHASIQRAMVYMYPPWDFDRARGYFNEFVDVYPQNAWANNALIWVARTYVRDAVHAGPNNDAMMKTYLQQAYINYERVLTKYPDGHVAREAKEELEYVNKLLSEISE